MPVYDFRLEGTGAMKGEYRVGGINAPDKKTAERWLLEREQKKVDYQLTDADLAADEESEAADGKTPADVRARLATHRQDAPYKLVKLEARR